MRLKRDGRRSKVREGSAATPRPALTIVDLRACQLMHALAA